MFSMMFFIPKLKAREWEVHFLFCFVIFICTMFKKNPSVYINFLIGLGLWMTLSFLFHPILTFPVFYLWSIVVFNLRWKLKPTILFRFLMFSFLKTLTGSKRLSSENQSQSLFLLMLFPIILLNRK